MSKIQRVTRQTAKVTNIMIRGLFKYLSITTKFISKTRLGKKSIAIYRRHHQNYVQKPHHRMISRSSLYAKWHNWNFKGTHHGHVHGFVAGANLLVAAVVVFNIFGQAFAADLSNTWDFGTPSSFNLSNGIETNGTAARLSTQEYSSDDNTNALYHLNETSGTTSDDASSNNNDLTLHNGASFSAGQLNNSLTLNGTSDYASASDSPSLSVTGQQSVEAWIKPDQTFNNTPGADMNIIDKGSYRLGLDGTSGKAFYEIENAGDGQWTKRLGDGNKGEWSSGHTTALSSVGYGTDLYVGVGGNTGDGEVWKWNGSTWEMVGGDGIRSSWSDGAYEGVYSLTTNGTALYAGLGSSAGDGEVWTCELSSNCASWTKIGGDGVGFTTTRIYSFTVHDGVLFVGGGNEGPSSGFADLYRYNGGTSWTQIGGDGLNGSWAINTFESVASLHSDDTYLYAGLGYSDGDAEVWRWDGAAWTKIGGDGMDGSWNTNFNSVRSMTSLNGTLYAGLGDAGNEAQVYSYNGTSWTNTNMVQSGNRTQIQSLATDGEHVYASATGLASGGVNTGRVSRWDGSTWTVIGGGGADSWPMAVAVPSLVWMNGKLYASVSSTNDNQGGMIWEWNGSTWTKIAGQYLNDSWGGVGNSAVTAGTTLNGKMYIAMGNYATDSIAQVYEYDGTSARRIGGSGLNGSWSVGYRTIDSMTTYKGELYIGTGGLTGSTTTGDVWKFDGTTWTKIGGQGIADTWGHPNFVNIPAMVVWRDNLYISTSGDNGGNRAHVWKWNGSTWTRVAGAGLNGSWNISYRSTTSLAVYGEKLCASSSGNNTDAAIWCMNTSDQWTQIAGLGVNNSWGAIPRINQLIVYKNKLHALLSIDNTERSSIWRFDEEISSWTQIAGNNLYGSWENGSYISPNSSPSVMATYNGDLYVSMANGNRPTAIWRYNGESWTQVAGEGINNSWATSLANNASSILLIYNGSLYAGTGSLNSGATAFLYSFGSNGYVESNTNSFPADWTHLAGTYDGINMKLYVNGVQDTSKTIATSGMDNSLPLLIGSSHGEKGKGNGMAYFKGQIDEVRVSNIARTSFNSKPYSDTPQTATLGTAVRKSGVAEWDGFTATENTNGGTISYRLTDDDGQNWKYWNGSSWSNSANVGQANSATVINDHIGDFPVTFDGIRWQAVLSGNGNQRVQLDSVTLTAASDGDQPVNASDIQAYRSNGGDEIPEDAWTNAPTPFLTWNAGSDGGSGVLGYCLYLGTSAAADPALTKGVLSTSPVDTRGNCQFTVSATELDLSTNGYLASALTTSNTPYYLNVKTIDRAGNISGDIEQFQFRFDNTPPSNPGFVTAPSQFVSNKEVTFTWPTSGPESPQDPNSGLQGLQYRIGQNGTWYGAGANGEGLLTNSGSYTTRSTPDFANIQEGNNTVFFRTWDQAGNVTTNYATAALRLNTASPGTPQNISASPETNSNNSFGFSWSVPASFTGSASAITYCYAINTAPTANTCSYTNPGVTSIAAGAYATQPGENTFYVVARDEAGNINYATAGSTTFTANTSAPGIPTDTDIADVSVKTTSSWKLALTWEAPTSVGAGVAAYRIERSIDGITFTQIASTAGASYVDGNLQQQKYHYRIRACDSANNCGAFGSTVAATPTGKFTTPAVITAQPSVTGVSTKKATVKWATDRASDSKISIGTTSGQYEPFQVASQAQVTDHTVELANLTPGTTYYAKAVWTDTDGNTGTSSEFSFKTAPAPSTQEATTIRTSLNSAQIRFTSVSAAKVVIQYGKSDSFGGVKEISTSLSKSTYDVEITGLDDGTKYLYRLNTFDAEGNEYVGSTVLSFTTPARPRIENLRLQSVEGEPTSTQRITWRTNVPTSSLVRFSSANIPAKEASSSQLTIDHEIIVRDLQDDTEYALVAESRDADGNLAVSGTQQLKTALDTRPPKISDITIETTIRGTGAEARGQVIVSWRTDEPSTSQVAYAEGSEVKVFNNKTSEDAALGLEHVVIVSDLPTSRVYSIRPLSKDRSGNEGAGETKPAIISRASDSVMTIVLNTLKKVFGF